MLISLLLKHTLKFEYEVGGAALYIHATGHVFRGLSYSPVQDSTLHTKSLRTKDTRNPRGGGGVFSIFC